MRAVHVAQTSDEVSINVEGGHPLTIAWPRGSLKGLPLDLQDGYRLWLNQRLILQLEEHGFSTQEIDEILYQLSINYENQS